MTKFPLCQTAQREFFILILNRMDEIDFEDELRQKRRRMPMG